MKTRGYIMVMGSNAEWTEETNERMEVIGGEDGHDARAVMKEIRAT